MKPQKILIGIIFAALLGIGYIAYAKNEKKQAFLASEYHQAGLREQNKAIAEMKAHEALLKRPICEEPLLVTIADIKFALPRTGLAVIDASGERREYLDRQCEIKHLDGIRNFHYPNAGMADLRYNDYKSQYQHDKVLIEEGRKNGRSRRVSGGMELITKGYLYIYVIPSFDITEDREPIVFNCPTMGSKPGEYAMTDSCQTQYLYKKNLGLGYRFFRNDYSAEGHLKADEDTRKRFNSWMIKGD